MPYINAEDNRREKLRNGEPASIAGELNYQIFYYTKYYYKKSYDYKSDILQLVEAFLRPKVCYQRYNDLTGCLLLCAKEIKRRLKIDVEKTFKKIIDSYDDEIAKYEDKKIKENGDVE